MPGVRMLFTGGEISPEMYGRTDTQRFGVSQRTVLNFLLTPAGAAKNRPGTKYVADAISASVAGRLIPFIVSDSISYVLELADGKMRFHTAGSTVQNWSGVHNGGVGVVLIDTLRSWSINQLAGKTLQNVTDATSGEIVSNSSTTVVDPGLQTWNPGDEYLIEGDYEVVIPWADDDLARLKFAQFNDMMVIVHPDYPPYVLRRYANTNWTLSLWNIARSVQPPTDVGFETKGDATSGRKLWAWVVTSVGRDGRESLVSTVWKDESAFVYPDNSQTTEYQINFVTPGDGAVPVRYNVYRGRDGAYGFVGDMEATEGATPGTTIEIFTDRGNAPDYSDSPPEGENPFEFSYPASGGAGLPRAVEFDAQWNAPPLSQEAKKDTAAEAYDKTYTVTVDVTFPAAGGSIVLDFSKNTGGVGPTALESHGVVATGATVVRVTKSFVIDGFAEDSDFDGSNPERILVKEASASTGVTWEGLTMTWTAASAAEDDLRILYPSAVCFFEQRLAFGGFNGEPSTFKASRTGDFFNFDRSLFTKDDDSLTLTLASSKLDEIRSMIPLRALLLFTAGAEWVVRGTEGGPLTPGSFDLKPDSWYGASWIDPVVIGRSVIYMTERGRIVRDFQYDPVSGAISDSKELTILARHLMEFDGVKSMAYAEVPHSVLWAVREDGVLLGLTYIREHDVWGWHRHYTGPGTITTPSSGYRRVSVRDEFEDVVSIPEDGENAVYVLVKRTIDGGTVRYVERFFNREGIEETADYVFVDSAISYDGRNTGAETMALAIGAGTDWIAGEEGLTLTRSVGTFGADDVGTAFEIRDAAGDWVRVEVTAQDGTAVCTVKIDSHVTDGGETEVPNTLRVGDGEYEGPFTDWGQAYKTFTGLDHLEGEDVAVLVDGAAHAEVTVSSGSITITVFGERVHAGLAIQSDIETLNPNFDRAPPEARLQRKSIKRVGLEVDNWEGLEIGQYMSDLVPVDERMVDEGYGATDPDRGVIITRPDQHDHNREVAVALRQSDPLPTTILAAVVDLDVEEDDQ